MKIFSVYDCKSESYSLPFFESTTAAGIRSFAEACRDPNSMLWKHGADYTLFEIGDFEQATGELVAYDAKVNLGLALEYGAVPEQVETHAPVDPPDLRERLQLAEKEIG